MNYEDFKLEDFLSCEEFRDWVIRPTASSHQFWEKWMQGHPEKREVILEARELIKSFQYQAAEVVSDDEKGDLLSDILNQPTPACKSIDVSKIIYMVAASFVLLFVAYFAFQTVSQQPEIEVEVSVREIVKENPRGQKTRITLPDGSKVWLNSESSIRYKSRFDTFRTIHLTGEAFFEVAHNPEKPFKVIANEVETTALGTSFNVTTLNDNHVEVGLVAGKVQVTYDKGNAPSTVSLEKGEMAVLCQTCQSLEVAPYADLDFIKWTTGTIVFKRAGFKDIKKKLERWYDVTVTSNDPDRSMTFTGEFTNESMERVLERMAFVEQFSFEIKDKQVKIIFE